MPVAPEPSQSEPGPKRRTAFLMPVYNPKPSELARTMASLLAQTEPADIVVVDDGSQRPVREALLPHGGLVVLRLAHNQGITGALNHGLGYIVAHGYSYVARMDCGDICTPDRIAKQQAHMDAHPELDLIGARAEIVDEAGHHLFHEGVSSGPAAIRRKLFDNAAFKHPTFFFRTRCIERLGPYSENYRHAEDYEFLRRVSRHGTLDCLDDVLLVYEKSTAGLSSRNRRRQLQSRLKIQLDYFDPRSPHAYVGVLRTLLTLLVPASAWATLSRLYWSRRERRAARPA